MDKNQLKLLPLDVTFWG